MTWRGFDEVCARVEDRRILVVLVDDVVLVDEVVVDVVEVVVAVLHAVVTHSDATHEGADVVAGASASTDHHHITVCARRLPGMMCQPSV